MDSEKQKRGATSVKSSVSKRRLSYTNLARLQLALSPLLMLLLLALNIGGAVKDGGQQFGESFWHFLKDDCRWLYRDVYRVARYGSVWDTVFDTVDPPGSAPTSSDRRAAGGGAHE